MLKLQLQDVRIDQSTRFYREGSVLGGTVTSGSLGVSVQVNVQSPEPPDRIAHLIRVARNSCFSHGALAEPVVIETNVRLNGQALAIPSR